VVLGLGLVLLLMVVVVENWSISPVAVRAVTVIRDGLSRISCPASARTAARIRSSAWIPAARACQDFCVS
jgi:hypothetical protein